MSTASVMPGFDDPVLDAASAFRVILDAMSRPGRPVRLPASPPVPSSLGPEAATVCLTLMDHETPLWLHPSCRNGGIEAWLRFHCGVRLTESLSDCRFAVMPIITAAEALPNLPIGTPEYPDRSATAVLLTENMTGGANAVLSGPGIKTEAKFAPAGAGEAFWKAVAANAELYPLGIDMLFAGDGCIAGLPRSTGILTRED